MSICASAHSIFALASSKSDCMADTDQKFTQVVQNLLKMKPKPHKGEGKGDDEKEGDGADRRPPASSNQTD